MNCDILRKNSYDVYGVSRIHSQLTPRLSFRSVPFRFVFPNIPEPQYSGTPIFRNYDVCVSSCPTEGTGVRIGDRTVSGQGPDPTRTRNATLVRRSTRSRRLRCRTHARGGVCWTKEMETPGSERRQQKGNWGRKERGEARGPGSAARGT